MSLVSFIRKQTDRDTASTSHTNVEFSNGTSIFKSSSISGCMHDQMLESNRDDVKLEAMRCVTVMTAKGKLSVPRTLFPHIVKNISSKNIELKKLIYLYLTNFADQEPDLALLSVATLQKSLKSPNPLIRSSALKTLTSMRLNILSVILMTTIRNSVNDLSPYVRKTAAHSIIKLYRLEPTFAEELVEFIERLLKDKNNIVISSAVASFEAVCPEKLSILKPHFKRFCTLLPDCNEWGQIVLVNLLKRYTLKRYEAIKKGEEEDAGCADQDPKVLLRSAKPLVHSDNSAVVMAVIELFIAIANYNEVRSTIVKPMIRLLNMHREIQTVVLSKIDHLTSLIEDLTSIEMSSETEKAKATPEQKLVIDGTNKVDPENLTPDAKQLIASIQSEVESIKITNDDEQVNQAFEGQQTTIQTPVDDEKQVVDAELTASFINKAELYNSIDSEFLAVNGSTDANQSKAEYSALEDNEEDKSVASNRNIEEDGDEENEDEEEYEEYETEVEVSTTDGDDDNEDETDESDLEVKLKLNSKPVEVNELSSKLSTVKSVKDKLRAESENISLSEIDYAARLADIESNKTKNTFREMFRPHIKSFFIKNSDCTQLRLAKLRILTNLTSSVNVTQVLRELQAYISIYVDDKEFVSATIQSIGLCALNVKEVAHTCLNKLTSLLSNNNEHIVSQAIVVLRSQIINKKPKSRDKMKLTVESNDLSKDSEEEDEDEDEEKKDKECINNHNENDDDKIISTVIKQVTKLLPTVEAPQARATILWILAEFCGTNLTAARCAPEVLRNMARTFCQQDAIVKLQMLTLASKLLISLNDNNELAATAPPKPDLREKVQLLSNYIFTLAKYDINHDVRDRGRFMKKLLCNHQISRQILLKVS